MPLDYQFEDLSEDQLAHETALYGGLAQSIRELAAASLRTTVAEDLVRETQREVEALTARLSAEMIPNENFGVRISSEGSIRGHGNAVVGLRNPVAPPLDIDHDATGARSSFHLNGLYEGPPGKVHGGVIALILDQIFGEAAAAAGSPGMTGTLTLRYGKATDLGDCSAQARVDRVEGVKTFVTGEFLNAAGEITVEAQGIFIMPRWARAAIAEHQQKMTRFE